jgi:hypothetical protein
MDPHVVYDLGPRLPPLDPIPLGEQPQWYGRGDDDDDGWPWDDHVLVLLDQLQTASTLSEAMKGTRALGGYPDVAARPRVIGDDSTRI